MVLLVRAATFVIVFILFTIRITELPPPLTYQGMCDASGAVAVTKDCYIVCDDENNVLRIFKQGVTNKEIDHSDDLSEFLEVTDDHREADIEGAARIGDRIYWIGSHGASHKAEERHNRRRLFATTVTQENNGKFVITPIGKPYKKLLKHLADYPAVSSLVDIHAASKLAPKEPNALNIEGLAATPDGDLLIGFRNPLIGGKAMVVQLKNPKKVVDDEADPHFGDVLLLDLGGRGIRSFDYFPDRQSYLIIAGPIGAVGEFDLYSWAGLGSEVCNKVPLNGWNDLHPEAVFAINAEIEILSDDGALEDGSSDQQECKSLPESQQRFRAVTLHELPSF